MFSPSAIPEPICLHTFLLPKKYIKIKRQINFYLSTARHFIKKPPPNNPSSSTPSKIFHVHLHPPQNSPSWSTPLSRKTTGREISPSIFQDVLALSKKELHLFKYNIHLCLKRINCLIQVGSLLNTE